MVYAQISEILTKTFVKIGLIKKAANKLPFLYLFNDKLIQFR